MCTSHRLPQLISGEIVYILYMCIFSINQYMEKSDNSDNLITIKKIRKIGTGILSVAFLDLIVSPFLQLGSLLYCDLY